jgi:peptidoglycan/xylan/chitin deacetylase (PgdA/CDA1 family)
MRALAGAGLAALLLPATVVAGAHPDALPGTALPGVAVAAAVAGLAARRRAPPRWLGGGVVAGAGWLLSQTAPGVIDWLLAATVGAGVALAYPRGRRRRDPLVALAAALASAALVACAAAGTTLGTAVVAVPAAALACGAVLERRASPAGAGALSGRALPVVGTAAATVALGLWIGANSPAATWFGALVSHGPRDRPLVALTFDDGPNAGATLTVRDILDAHGVKGTFFTVGKALDRRPDISRALLADGQVLGNHSYLHDQLRWLDPRYPELERTQQAFRRRLGVCPALFRPPHGEHTPFMAWVVHRHRMRMVTWDVSAGDWATHDPALVARRVLDQVRPGSIILLHDGLDGDVTADRSVVVRALPAILDGLKARGLHPVTLDRLLGTRPYVATC